MLRHVTTMALAVALLGTSIADAQRGRGNRRAEGDSNRPQVSLGDLEEIVPKLQSANPDEVREAIDLLSVIDRPEVVPHLATLLRSGQPDTITDRALEALRGLAAPQSIEVLTEFTNHRRIAARRRAYQALAAIEDRRIPALLERGLRDSDRTVRGAAALALGDIGATRSLDVLFRAFERGVIEAAIAIGKLGNQASVERYDAFLGNEPLGVMLSGYGEYLRRRDIPQGTKKAIIERLGEVAGVMVRRFLGEYLNTLPERTRNRQIRELKELLQETIARIPEEAAGTRIGPQAAEGGAQ